MKYLDTVIEGVARLEKARENLNKILKILFVFFVLLSFAGLGFFILGYMFSGLFILVLALMYLVLLVAILIKREIYSLAILIKKQ